MDLRSEGSYLWLILERVVIRILRTYSTPNTCMHVCIPHKGVYAPSLLEMKPKLDVVNRPKHTSQLHITTNNALFSVHMGYIVQMEQGQSSPYILPFLLRASFQWPLSAGYSRQHIDRAHVLIHMPHLRAVYISLCLNGT